MRVGRATGSAADFIPPHAALSVRNEVVQSCRDFFYQRDFVLIDSPILTGSSVEGTSTLFETDYFGEKAYLSQSGQLYLEPAAASFGKVYCFGPTFRAEKSKTRRHLTEFWMIEPEVAFADHAIRHDVGDGSCCPGQRRQIREVGFPVVRLVEQPAEFARTVGMNEIVALPVDEIDRIARPGQPGGRHGAAAADRS